MNKKQFLQKLQTISKWFDNDNVFFSLYSENLEKCKKHFGNDFQSKFFELVKVWENLTKVEYLHTLTLEEKIYKFRFSFHSL